MRITAHTPDNVVIEELGARLRAIRLQRNLSQERLAEEAGIGRVTLQRLEEGKANASMPSLIKVLRALDLSEGLDQLIPAPRPSPVEEADRRRRPRRRASSSGPKAPRDEGWRWGDEESD
jgi:transcriptional regulator with XRE-family HTH domain